MYLMMGEYLPCIWHGARVANTARRALEAQLYSRQSHPESVPLGDWLRIACHLPSGWQLRILCEPFAKDR